MSAGVVMAAALKTSDAAIMFSVAIWTTVEKGFS